METRFKLYEALSEAMNNEEWVSWLNEYVIVNHEAEIKFDTMPPGGLHEKPWSTLKSLLQTTAKEYHDKAKQRIAAAVIAANQLLDAPMHSIVLHLSWRRLFNPRQFYLLGAPVRFSSTPPQMLFSEEKYGKWVAIFPGELAEYDKINDERRRKFALKREKNDNT